MSPGGIPKFLSRLLWIITATYCSTNPEDPATAVTFIDAPNRAVDMLQCLETDSDHWGRMDT